MRGIKDCGSLAECDKYFENLLDSLGNPRLLGYKRKKPRFLRGVAGLKWGENPNTKLAL
jgi:hypothetical protein